VLSNCRSLVLTIIVSKVSFLGASELISGLIGAEGVLCSGSPIVIITSSLVSLILGAFIGLNTVTTSLGSSSF
jgi:membrane associated rhomboid family serine protease